MPAPKSDYSGRWTVTVPDDEVKPVGSPDCALRAVARLGPFKYRTHKDAEGTSRRNDHRPIVFSEELAWERVWILARDFNRQRRLDQGAPRAGDVVERLTRLEDLAGEMARELNSLDDITRHRLQTGGTGITAYIEIAIDPLLEAADVEGLPAPTGWKDEGEPDRWVQRLEALSLYSNACLKMFLSSQDISSVDVPDKGGNTNLYKSIFGSASSALVNEGWHLFELCRPREASGTEGGPFHLFLMDVFEFATGLEPEQHSKLTYWLKRVSSVKRKLQALEDEQEKLSKEQREISLSRIEPGWERRERRIVEIGEALIDIERRRSQLWHAQYPFSRTARKARKAG